MKKSAIPFLLALFLFQNKSNAQVEVVRMLGDEEYYKFGYGGFLKYSHPISEADYLALEVGALIFPEVDYPESGLGIVPLKLSYRFTLNRSGSGLYLEPAGGYTLFAGYDDDYYEPVRFKGFIAAGGIGFLFQPGRKLQLDLGLRYETVIYKGGRRSFVGLRLSQNFSFGRRDY